VAADALTAAVRNADTLQLQADVMLTDQGYANSAFTPQDFSRLAGILDEAIALSPGDQNLRAKRELVKTLME
jgi:hypothetical protein